MLLDSPQIGASAHKLGHDKAQLSLRLTARSWNACCGLLHGLHIVADGKLAAS